MSMRFSVCRDACSRRVAGPRGHGARRTAASSPRRDDEVDLAHACRCDVVTWCVHVRGKHTQADCGGLLPSPASRTRPHASECGRVIVKAIAAPPRVTIATPTWNRARFLPETLESLLAQDYPNLELLVVDDGSTDDTPAVVAKFVARKPDVVRYIRQPNTGEAGATNHAWRVATGSLFGVVCSDDPQPPGLVRASVECLQANPDVIVSYPDWWWLDGRGARIKQVNLPEFSLERLIAMCHCFPGPGAFIRRDAVYDRLPVLRNPRYTLVSDYCSYLWLCQFGPFKRIPHTIAAWRCHPSGASSVNRGRKHAAEHVRLFKDFFSEPNLPDNIAQYKDRALIGIHRLAANCVGRRDPVVWSMYRLQEMMYARRHT